MTSFMDWFDVELTPELKLLLLACMGLLFVVTILVVVCSVTPLCCLYHYCPWGKQAEKEAQDRTPLYGSTLQDVPLEQHKLQALRDKHPGFWHHLGPPMSRESETSEWSDASTAGILETRKKRVRHTAERQTVDWEQKDISDAAGPTLYSHQEARLKYALAFHQSEARLDIRILQLTNFRAADPEGVMTPYVKVRLYRAPRHFFTFRGKPNKEELLNNLDVEFQTKIQRRAEDPIFNEIFAAPVSPGDLSHLTLRLLVCDFDRFSRHVVIGEICRALGTLQLTSEPTEFEEELQSPLEENLGEIQVALLYLPTAEKLTLTVIKAQNLKAVDSQRNTSDVLVRISLMYDGRHMKKAKTTLKQADLNPVFNESFTFDVPSYQLEKVYFCASVVHHDVRKPPEQQKKILIGHLYLGLNFDSAARAQWAEMIQNPRRPISAWHKLQI